MLLRCWREWEVGLIIIGVAFDGCWIERRKERLVMLPGSLSLLRDVVGVSSMDLAACYCCCWTHFMDCTWLVTSVALPPY